MNNFMIRYLIARLQETSTIRNIIRLLAMIASFVGYSISEEMQIQFIVIGIGISGLVGIFLPDNLKAEKEGEIKLTENEVIEQKLKQIEGVDEDFKNATRQRTFEETGFNDRTFIPVNSRFTPNS